MTEPPDDDALAQLVRARLRGLARGAPDRPALHDAEQRADRHRRRRRSRVAVAGSSAGVIVLAVALAAAVPVQGPAQTAHQSAAGVVAQPLPQAAGPMRGALVLPLTGSVSGAGLALYVPQVGRGHGGVESLGLGLGQGQSTDGAGAFAASRPDARLGQVGAGGGAVDQTIDVPPGTGQTLDKLSTHVSPDGVIASSFLTPNPTPPQTPLPGENLHGQASSGSPKGAGGPAAANSCAPSAQVTLEVSDIRAVATFTEPFYGGFTSPLIDVEIGEFGDTEGSPATWVEAEVGSGAASVVVHFADGATDSTVPAGSVAVLAHQGPAATVIGTGGTSTLDVLDSGGAVLASFTLSVEPPSTAPALLPPPTVLPHTTRHQATDTAAARKAIGQALATALSCKETPVQQSQRVHFGGPFEALGGAGSSGMAPGDSVVVQGLVFTSATTAVVRYAVDVKGLGRTASLFARADLVDGDWLVSLGSVAPGLQVAPPNQDGDVSVAPGGPLYVATGPGGTAIAVYRSAATGSSGNCYPTCKASPDSPDCVPTGGVVEEVTTPGAVGILSAPLFARYTNALIGVGLATVGQDEGAPATVVTTEVSPGVADLEVATHAGTQRIVPVGGAADGVLGGAPSTSIGPQGATIDAVDTAGTVLDAVPVVVDAGQPAPSLPSSLPAAGAGTQPADPAAATTAIEEVFSTVFSCASAPLVRAQDIEDNGLFANPLEQLYLGPYVSLVESVYPTVHSVVFQSPTLADVSYTLAFHNDPSLSFDQLGTAVLVDGSWRVSYATLCAAVALGGVHCST